MIWYLNQVARKLASMQHGWKVKEANDKQRQLEQKEARKQTLAADERVVEAMKQRRDTSRTRKEVLSMSVIWLRLE